MLDRPIVRNALLEPRLIAQELMTTVDDLARSAGLGRDALARPERAATPRVQTRLRELVEILNRVELRFGSALMAYAWYRSQPLPGFGGKTGMTLVIEGRASEVLEFVEAVDAGVYA